jgi:phosphatidylglycerophosphate synthase
MTEMSRAPAPSRAAAAADPAGVGLPAAATHPVGGAAGWGVGVGFGITGLAVVLAMISDLPAAVPITSAVAMAAVVASMLWGLARMPAGAPAPFAVCNRVTLVRAGLAALLGGMLAAPGALAAEPALAWALLAVAVGALALDGVDGWLARARGEASAFGARFDMEVDAALILVLAALAWATGKTGAWVLALGLMRYGFVAAGAVLPWLAAPLPESVRRKAGCVMQVAVLAGLLAPVVQPPVSDLLAAGALAVLTLSFAVDVRWLWRHRTGAP